MGDLVHSARMLLGGGTDARAPATTTKKKRDLVLALLAFGAFGFVYYRNAWAIDDAYITYRTVDNVINGYGLTWNPAERVQTYTHPLWMLLHVAVVSVTREFFFSGIAISFALCAGLFAYFWRRSSAAGLGWRLPVLMAAVLSSKAVFDYTSSGLENPLSYLLATLFFVPWLELGPNEAPDNRRALVCCFLAALAFVNRQDTLLVYLPALAYITYGAFRARQWSFIGTALLATSPAWLWMLFSLWYYGFPFPNTYYAKAANSGVPLHDKLALGLNYLKASMIADLPSLVYLSVGTAYALYRRQHKLVLPLVGALLYVAYVVVSAASATHMAHRFFSLPVLVVLLVLVMSLEKARLGLVWVAGATAALLALPNSPLRIGHPSYQVQNAPNAADIKWYAHNEGASLRSNVPPERIVPNNDWYKDGLHFRDTSTRVRWGGPGNLGSWAMGFFGLGAGPAKHVVDPLGLCDPLLARLPARPQETWLSGHYERPLPAGYLETLESGVNAVSDSDLREYYANLRQVIAGSLWSEGRLEKIAKLNLGTYDRLLQHYIVRQRSSGRR